MVKVTVNGICREYENGVTYEKLAQEHQAEYDHRIILAIANGKIKELPQGGQGFRGIFHRQGLLLHSQGRTG